MVDSEIDSKDETRSVGHRADGQQLPECGATLDHQHFAGAVWRERVDTSAATLRPPSNRDCCHARRNEFALRRASFVWSALVCGRFAKRSISLLQDAMPVAS